MDNSEFYTPQENWPQPADDPATLLPAEPPEVAPKKQKKKRLRKKMSESLSGMTAAALAVVMLTTAVFDEKGGFGGGFDVSPGGGGVEICPVCYDPHCDYFVDGYPGLRISGAHIDSGDGLYQPYDLYHMNGMTDYYIDYMDQTFGLFTEDGQRLVFHLNRDFYRNHWSGMDSWWRDIYEEPRWSAGKTTGKAGQMIVIRDPKSDTYLGFVMVYLVHDPNGVPGFDADLPWEEHSDFLSEKTVPEFRTIPVSGIPNAEIQIYTDLGSDYADAVMQYCSVDVVPAFTVQKIGKTMKLTEAEHMHRDYRDIQVSGMIAHMGQEGDRRVFYASFSFASYFLAGGPQHVWKSRVMILPGVDGEDWNVILRRALKLNQNAKATGHPVCFPLYQLTDVTINGITYDIWMSYNLEEDDKSDEIWYRPHYVFVPRQEPTVAITYEIDRLSSEEFAALLQKPEAYFTPQSLSFIWNLEQISLR